MHDLKLLFPYEGENIHKNEKQKKYLIVLYESSTPSRGKRYNRRCKVGKSPRGPARQCGNFAEKCIIYLFNFSYLRKDFDVA